MRRDFRLMQSIPFLFMLTVLLVNDFVFKQMFGNWFTGKLSDFTGVFVFAIFWQTFFPEKKWAVYVFVVLIFTWWKSPYSDSYIHLWNSFMPITLIRTVDYTDLIAFVILPFAFYYDQLEISHWRINIPSAVIVGLCGYAFVA